MHQTTDNYKKHTSKNPIHKWLIDRFILALVREARILKPATILEAGCGEGFVLERLYRANIGEKLTGIDFLETAIQIGKKERPHLDLRVADIYKLPFKDNSFDLVICSEVLEHLKEPEKALKELHRVCKKYVILSVPNEPLFSISNFVRFKNWSRLGNDIEHIQHWSGSSFEKFISSKFVVFTRKQPFPWTLLVAEKK